MFTESRVRFEIPGFGSSVLRPEDFATALADCAGKSRETLVKEIQDEGWQLTVIDEWQERDLTWVEIVAIYAESRGYGLV